MGIRLYLCPIVGDGVSTNTAFRPKLSGLADFAAMIPSNPDGTPQRTWASAVVRAIDWTALDADSTIEKLFDTADWPDTFNTFAEVRTFLQSKTVADIPPLRRQALNDRLIAHGLDTSQVTLATTWWQVLRGIYRQLNGGVNIANDGPQI